MTRWQFLTHQARRAPYQLLVNRKRVQRAMRDMVLWRRGYGRASGTRPIAGMHHSDPGMQYAAPQYIQTLQAARIQIRMATVGEPPQNGYAEWVRRTMREKAIA